MTKRWRGIIYIIFVVLFLISVPVILFYTAGYRYNFKKNRVERTGVLILDSKPENANIFINNKKFKSKTPAHLGALLPEEYQIKVEKDGYFPWAKNLLINPAETTFANKILLPKNVNPEFVVREKIDWLSASPSGKAFIFASLSSTSTEVKSFALDSKKINYITKIATKNLASLRLSWASDEVAILQTPTPTARFLLINIVARQKVTELSELIGEGVKKAYSDPLLQNKILVLGERSLYRVDASSLKKEFLEKINYDDYANQSGVLYFINTHLKNFYLASKSTVGGVETKNLISLDAGKYQFLESPDGFLLLRKDNQIILIKLKDEPRIILNREANEARWFRVGAGWHLLYYTDFELYTYDAEKEVEKLITRLGEKIYKARAIADSEHIIFLSGNTIKIIELDERDRRNIWDIASGNGLKDFALDINKNMIYFPIINEESGLYRREL